MRNVLALIDFCREKSNYSFVFIIPVSSENEEHEFRSKISLPNCDFIFFDTDIGKIAAIRQIGAHYHFEFSKEVHEKTQSFMNKNNVFIREYSEITYF